MPGNDETILSIPVDRSQIDPAIDSLKEMNDMIEKVSKTAKEKFSTFNYGVEKNNKSLTKSNVVMDKMFRNIKLSKLSGGFADMGQAVSGTSSALGMGGMATASFVGAISLAISKGLSTALKSVSTTMMARRSGITAGQAAGLEYSEEQMGLSKGALTQTAYNLNNSLKDVTKAGAISVLSGGSLDINKLKEDDSATAMFKILDSISKNKMAKDPNMRATMMKYGAELGINEQVMLDALQNQKYTKETKQKYQVGVNEFKGTDWESSMGLGRSVSNIKHTAKAIGMKALGSTSKGIIDLSAGIDSLTKTKDKSSLGKSSVTHKVVVTAGDGLKATVEKSNGISSVVAKQSTGANQ